MTRNHRLLVIDDLPSIHDDFRKILNPAPSADEGLADDEALLFGQAMHQPAISYEIHSAYQGREALEMVVKSLADRPYALAFVDMRMPPGWDGLETVEHLQRADPRLQIVICTAFFEGLIDGEFDSPGSHDRLIVLGKPFDTKTVQGLAQTMTNRWNTAYENALST